MLLPSYGQLLSQASISVGRTGAVTTSKEGPRDCCHLVARDSSRALTFNWGHPTATGDMVGVRAVTLIFDLTMGRLTARSSSIPSAVPSSPGAGWGVGGSLGSASRVPLLPLLSRLQLSS